MAAPIPPPPPVTRAACPANRNWLANVSKQVPNSRFFGFALVVNRGGFRGLAIATFDRLDYGGVLLHRFQGTALNIVWRKPAESVLDLGQKTVHVRVCRSRPKERMEFAVDANHVVDLFRLAGASHRVQILLELNLDIHVVSLRGEPRGYAVERLLDDIERRHFLQGHRCDDQSTIRAGGKKPLCHEAHQRLADWGAADAVLLGERLLAEPCSRHDLALDNRVTKSVGDPVPQSIVVRVLPPGSALTPGSGELLYTVCTRSVYGPLRRHPMAVAGLAVEVREVFPGRLFVLGGAYELDGRVTWAPSDARGFQATNCFLLREGSRATLIDPGPAYHADGLMAQLATLLPVGFALDVFLTRAEFDCFGCLGALSARYRIGKLMTGGAHNPFDAFDDVSQETPMQRLAVGSSVNIGGSRELMVIRPAIRLLATFWAYDSGTRSLFTSDVFTHLIGATAAEATNVDADASAALGQVHRHLLAKHWWLSAANTQPLVAALAEIFTSRQVDCICPDRGRVIYGRSAVDQTYSAMRKVLLDIGEAS